MSALNPTSASERLTLLDSLRGFALYGILLANLVSFAGYYSLSLVEIRELPRLDRATLFLIDWLIEGKFYALFSLLLGAGFELQARRAQGAGVSFMRVWYRRMLALMCIGLTHMYLIWYGDILTLYGVLGLLLPLLAAMEPKRLKLSVIVLLILPLAMHALATLTKDHAFWTSLSRLAAEIRTGLGYGDRSTLQMLTSGSAREVLAANVLGALQRPMAYLQTGRIFQVLGLFLLGVVLARTVLPRLQRGEPFPMRAWIICALTGLSTSLVYAWIKAKTGAPFSLDGQGFLQGLVYHAGSTLLALGYAGAMVLAWRSGVWRAGLEILAVPGRMALSNYIAQSVICVAIFYGYGFSFMGRVSFALLPVLAFAILVMQWALCRAWLRNFARGPLEHAWRKLTY